MTRSQPVAFALLLAASALQAQWTLQQSGTASDLRGISSINTRVALASGTHGTVLRTVDGGQLWRKCAIPPNAERLDFRGLDATGDQTAYIMSSGPGDLSRLYKTTDGCRTWTLLSINVPKDGFWDAIALNTRTPAIYRLGDPVAGHFVLERSNDGIHWSQAEGQWQALGGEAAFAASNSLLLTEPDLCFVTGGTHSELIRAHDRSALPFAPGESSGAFSIATDGQGTVVVVGGDYKHPDSRSATAAFSRDGGFHFTSAASPPGGYRSAVAFRRPDKIWIAVGPNGTDISRDGGLHWTPLAGVNGANWNALSLPYVVGPHGRIGKLTEHRK